jgi:hypothetical protein
MRLARQPAAVIFDMGGLLFAANRIDALVIATI